jgi:hypothetical protein
MKKLINGPDEFLRVPRHHDAHLVAGRDEEARQFTRLVGGDSARHAK